MPVFITKEDNDAEGEQRFVALGMDNLGKAIGRGLYLSRRRLQ